MKDWTRKSISTVKQQLRTTRERRASDTSLMTDESLAGTRIMTGAGIALSVIILQAFIATGVSEPFALAAVLFFALALPMQAALIFIVYDIKLLKPTHPSKAPTFLFYVGNLSCLVGILATFCHISLIAGFVLCISCAITIPLFLYHDIFVRKSPGIDD